MRYLAIDYGQKRIGLAVSDAGESMAFPHSVIDATAEPISRIARIIQQESVESILVGLPLNMDGTEGPQAKAARLFAQKLSRQVEMEVEFFDERLSSAEADWKLTGLELTRGKKKKLQDAVAAAAFLQSFLDGKKKDKTIPEIIRLQTPQQVAQKALEIFSRCAADAMRQKGRFMCVISGGESPRDFFKLLAADKSLDWSKIFLFWADERGVSPKHPDSNFKLAIDTFLSSVSIPQNNIHRIIAELPDIVQAARQYEAVIQSAFSIHPGEIPEFDLVMLGLGADGHTASLLPDTDTVDIHNHLTAVADKPSLPYPRVTLTVDVLLAARKLIFLITGLQKAQIVNTVIHGVCDPRQWPIHALWPARQKMTWLLDSEAASLLR